MGTSAMQDDPMLRLRYYKETGQADEAAKYEHYLRDTGQWKEPTQDRQLHARDVARRMTSANEADAAAVPSYGSTVAGGIAALLKSVPGGEAAQAALRTYVRGDFHKNSPTYNPDVAGQYRNALQDIRGAESDNPASGANSFIGGTVAAAAMPGSPVVAGGLYGGANGLLSADGSVGDRVGNAMTQATFGMAAGKYLPALAAYAKSKRTPTIDVQDVARNKSLKLADDLAYGLAKMEGTGAAITPAVEKAMANPITSEYASIIRNAPQHANADEATILRETYKLMSRDQSGHAAFMEKNGFDALRDTKMGAIASAKRQLLDAAAAGHQVPAPPVATAQSPAPSVRDAIGNFWDRIGLVHSRASGTVEQQMARAALERHGAENIVSPPLTGSPSAPRMLDAPGMMPSLPNAVAQHARLTKVSEAGQDASNIADRILKGAHIAGENLKFKSPAAFKETIPDMTPDEAKAALDMMLGRAHEYRAGAKVNPLKLFGLGSNVARMAKLQPFLDQLAAQAGQAPFGQGSRAVTQSAVAGLMNP